MSATPVEMPPYQYIVLHTSVRNDLGKLAVMSAHAAGESCFLSAAQSETRVVVLEALKSADLEDAERRLLDEGIMCALIREPDPPYLNAAVALGIMPRQDRERVKSLLANFKLFR